VSVHVAAMLPPLKSSTRGFVPTADVVALLTQAGGLTGSTVPVAMSSVGLAPPGVGVNFPGIAPPDRKRLGKLLSAAFKDPCACLVDEVELTTTELGPSFERNDDIVDPVPTYPVTIETAPPTSTTTAELTNDPNPYDIYDVRISLITDSGEVSMPGSGVGDLGDIAEMVRVSGKKTRILVSWVVGRTGIPPVLPKYETDNPNLRPVCGTITSQNVELATDGSGFVYMTAGYYIYEVINPTTVQMTTAAPAYITPSLTGAVTAAATAAYTASITNDFEGPTDSNPFVPGGVSVDTPPTPDSGADPALGGDPFTGNVGIVGLGGAVIPGGFMDFGTSKNLNPANPDFPDDPFFNPPPVGP
jgi:hypothetical protein